MTRIHLALSGALAAVLAFAAVPALAQTPPTPAEAKAFVAEAEKVFAESSEAGARAQWVRATNITFDTEWLENRADTAATELAVKYAKQAARFDKTPLDARTRRKLLLIKLGLTLPAPDRPGAAAELSEIGTRMDSVYSTGKFPYKGRLITLQEAEGILASSRDPAELKAVYEGWREVSKAMKTDYARQVVIANEGARDLGFKDVGALWRSGYDMDPDAFAAETDRLWEQVKPFYQNLHCYVRARLNAKYGDAVQPKTGPIRADLLGNMWAQDWSNIYDAVQPTGIPPSSYSLTALLKAHKFDAVQMVKTAEGFYVSLGLPKQPATFWERSQITRPRDREVVCHPSAWDLDNLDDVRIKMCAEVNGEDFYTVHHELGHNYYQRAYKDQDFLFKGGANDGFHEAIGDFIGLSALTPTYLHQIGLLDQVPGEAEDIPFLLKMGLQKIAFLPFGLMVDRWRWEVFSGKITPAEYNARWSALMRHYQGLIPPGARPADAFDPGAKYHVAANVPYTRYFLAYILQFQFQRAACAQAGWKGPLHRCSIYNQKQVGARFAKMLKMGQEYPWPDELEAFTGERRMDASAILDYFAPLNAWLEAQNKGQSCGWDA